MTDLERRALLGDAKSQRECTENGIALACPKCYGKNPHGACFSIDGYPALLDDQFGVSPRLHGAGKFQKILELDIFGFDFNFMGLHKIPRS